MDAEVAADPGFLIASKRHIGIDQVVAIDPDRAGLDPGYEVHRFLEIVSPQRGRQAHFGIIGKVDRFVLIVEGGDGDQRPEDLLPGYGKLRSRADYNGRPDIVASAVGTFTSRDNLGAILTRALYGPESSRGAVMKPRD